MQLHGILHLVGSGRRQHRQDSRNPSIKTETMSISDDLDAITDCSAGDAADGFEGGWKSLWEDEFEGELGVLLRYGCGLFPEHAIGADNVDVLVDNAGSLVCAHV
jgi:hypothetical protein